MKLKPESASVRGEDASLYQANYQANDLLSADSSRRYEDGEDHLVRAINITMHMRLKGYLDKLIATNRLPCAEIIVSHKGRIICDYRSVDAIPQFSRGDLIYRMYSMTKPIVTCALMVLFERGEFQLSQPAWMFLGDAWKKENMRVMNLAETLKSGKLVTGPCKRDITLAHLMTHTSGLSHGFSKGSGNPLDDIYADAGLSTDDTVLLRIENPGYPDVSTFLNKLAKYPLMFQPGEQWQYSYGLELIGHIVEVVSGQNLNDFIQENICTKLGMHDTTFYLSAEQKKRLCPFYLYNPTSSTLSIAETHFPIYCSGSAGLYSTASDYHKFCRAMLRGGLGDNGRRILSSKTVEWMMKNRLRRDNRPTTVTEIAALPTTLSPGIGFGFGASVCVDPSYDNEINSLGEYSWAGATLTYFWVDPEEEVCVSFMTSVFEPDKQNLALYATLHALVYGALNDTKRHPQQ